ARSEGHGGGKRWIGAAGEHVDHHASSPELAAERLDVHLHSAGITRSRARQRTPVDAEHRDPKRSHSLPSTGPVLPPTCEVGKSARPSRPDHTCTARLPGESRTTAALLQSRHADRTLSTTNPRSDGRTPDRTHCCTAEIPHRSQIAPPP